MKTNKQDTEQVCDSETSNSSYLCPDIEPANKLQDALADYLFTQIPTISRNFNSEYYCPFCSSRLVDGVNIKYLAIYQQFFWSGGIRFKPKVEKTIRHVYLHGCVHCQTVFADSTQYDKIRTYCGKYSIPRIDPHAYSNVQKMMMNVTEKTRSNNAVAVEKEAQHTDSSHIPPKTVQFDLSKEDNLSKSGVVVLVYEKKCHCTKCSAIFPENTIINRTAVIDAIGGASVHTTVMYCKGCGQYFISSKVLRQYSTRLGGLLLELSSEKNPHITSSKGSFRFRDDSVLSRCGYNVKEGTSTSKRHAILKFILDSKRASKYEIIELLNGFIAVRQNNPSMNDACIRWQEDIRFVNEYKMNYQEKVFNVRFQRR